MNRKQSSFNNRVARGLQILHHSRRHPSRNHQFNCAELTFGQRLADRMANYVGSWSFLFVQSTVLLLWIVLNVLPGFRHWDPAPFILLNLIFSFASAYTAPVVLISQNCQAEIDRQNAACNHEVNLKAGQDIERLHEKMDSLWEQQLKELTQIVKQQQQSLNEIKLSVGHAQHAARIHNGGKLLDRFSEGKSFSRSQSIGNTSKFADKGVGSI